MFTRVPGFWAILLDSRKAAKLAKLLWRSVFLLESRGPGGSQHKTTTSTNEATTESKPRYGRHFCKYIQQSIYFLPNRSKRQKKQRKLLASPTIGCGRKPHKGSTKHLENHKGTWNYYLLAQFRQLHWSIQTYIDKAFRPHISSKPRKPLGRSFRRNPRMGRKSSELWSRSVRGSFTCSPMRWRCQKEKSQKPQVLVNFSFYQ